MKQPVKVYAIFRWDSDSDSSELEFLCASEIMARRVLEQIKIREGGEGEYFKDGMAFETEGAYFEIETEHVWEQNPENDPYNDEIIRKARS